MIFGEYSVENKNQHASVCKLFSKSILCFFSSARNTKFCYDYMLTLLKISPWKILRADAGLIGSREPH